MRRVAVTTAVVAAGVLAVVLVKCRGSATGGKSTSQKVTTTGGTAGARAPREDRPDPRKSARVAIHGVVRAKTGGAPIAGAQVCATGHVVKASPDETRDPKCVTTDARGAYGLDDLYAGSYWVSASAATYRPAQWRGPAPDRDPEIKLTAGGRRDDIDVALAAGGVEVKGTVSDISGGPIAEAWVSVSTGMWWTYDASSRARTAADGTYSVWVAPGAVHADASADGYASGSAQGKAPSAHLDILLTPESVLAGTVVEAEGGAPVAGASVRAQTGWGDDPFSWGGGANGTAITDDKGQFRITRLAPGRYRPSAESLGRYGEPAESVMLGLGQTVEGVVIPVHAVQVVTGRIVIDDGTGNLPGCGNGYVYVHGKTDRTFSAQTDPDGAVRIDAIVPGTYIVNIGCAGYLQEDKYPDLVVASADVTGQVWKVHVGGNIAGTVVSKAGGTPIAQVDIDARTVGGDPRGQQSWQRGTTEDDGTFLLRGLAPGDYELTPRADKYPEPKDPFKVTVTAGATATAQIVLDDGGAIAGVVVDEHGAPVLAANVQATGERWDFNGWGERTGDDGSFTIEGLRPGSYRVSASRGWMNAMRKPGTTDDDIQGERATVTAGQTARVHLVVESQTGTIAGTVVDSGGKPIPDAYLATDRESDAAGADASSAVRGSRWGWDKKPVVTDATGAFKIGDLSPGAYTVRAYRKGGGEAIAEHVPVGTKSARLVMKPTGTIAGTVKLADGRTPDDFTISAGDEKVGFTRREQFFRTGGTFKLAELPAGTFVITASAPEGAVDQTVTLTEGEAKTGITLVLEARVTVTGRLVALDDGTPVPGLQVMVNPIKGQGGAFVFSSGDNKKQSISGPDGRFSVDDAPAGRVFVQAWPMDFDNSKFGFVRVPRTLAGGGTVDVGDIKVARMKVANMRDRGGDLGFELKEQPPDIEPEDSKIEVSRVRPDGPAAKTGLVAGDVIVSVDGTDVAGANSYLAWSLMDVPVGATITLGLARSASVAIIAGPQP